MTFPEEFTELARAVRNWGRWGPDDERGTLNLITPEVLRRGVAAVRDGRAIPLWVPLSEDGPQAGLVPGRENPRRRMITINQPLTGDQEGFCSSDDEITMATQAATHWDALAHVSYGGRIYNGYPADTITDAGATRCGIDKVGPLVGRGVLLDVARARGVERLEPGTVVGAEDLDTAEELAGVRVEPGDIVLLRTGHIQVLHAGDRVAYAFPSPGPGMQAARWFHDRDVAAVATDTLTFEVFPCERDDLLLPVHLLDLVEMGMLQGQNFDLETLAADCAADGRYTFLLQATPEPVERGLGGPVAPVAIK